MAGRKVLERTRFLVKCVRTDYDFSRFIFVFVRVQEKYINLY